MSNRFIMISLAIIILVVLFLASPRGKDFLEKSKLKDKLSIIGNFFKNITGRITSIKNFEGKKIEIKLHAVNPAYMNGQEIILKNSEISINLNPETATLDTMTITFKSSTNIYSSSFNGKMNFYQDKISIEGKTNDISIDNFSVNKTDIPFSLSGKPIKYKITNINKDVLSFNEVSGSLVWVNLKNPAILQKDKLDLYNFEGTIEEKNDLLYIEGTVTYMKLNNVPIGVYK